MRRSLITARQSIAGALYGLLLALALPCLARAQVDGGVPLEQPSTDASIEPDADVVDAEVTPIDASAEPVLAAEPDAEVPDADVPDADVPDVEVTPIDASSEPVLTAAPDPGAIDVTVRSPARASERASNSAEAITVIDLKRARQQSVDLGEVLARTQGVGVRRQGGLGSDAIISLNGLQNDQVRLFIDGIPLERSGYPLGIVNVPVNLIDRAEVYRGVVPIRLGADALGGAIELITDPAYETHLNASFQAGSYGIYRSAVNGRYRHAPTNLVVGASMFVDSARNDFMMDDRPLSIGGGRSRIVSAPRFNDQYRAYGGNVEVGVLDKRWARRLLVQGSATTFDKGLQHNMVMTVPYGEMRRGQDSYGATVRYDVDISKTVAVESFANYARRRIDFQDLSSWRYNWLGERTMPVGRPGQRGENALPDDFSLFEDSVMGRVNLSWSPSTTHIVRASTTPMFTTRAGENYLPVTVDNLRLRSRVMQIVSGIEYELNVFGDRLQNIVFAKHYYMDVSNKLRQIGSFAVQTQTRDLRNWGVGDAIRYRITDSLIAKASYEYATRLPRIDELFGDGAFIEANASLKPEQSHNVNFGPRLALKRSLIGNVTVDVSGFLRETKDQIVLLATATGAPHANISDMRGRGVEAATSWTSREGLLALAGSRATLDGSITYLDLRNTSSEGTFAALNGLRIPNRPYFFASWGGRLRFARLPGFSDALEPFYYGRYTHEFDRGWALGQPAWRLRVDRQVNHDVGVTYTFQRDLGSFNATFEVDNLTDAKLFDVYGVQRPGRSFNVKIGGQI